MNLFDIIRLNVEFFFEDVEEIGSSDVSCCVNAVTLALADAGTI